LVEAQIARAVVAALLHCLFHACVGGLDLGDVARRGALGGHAHGGRLDDAAQLLQIAQELARQSDLGLPGDHVGVEPVPLVVPEHARPELRTGDEQTLGDERLDRLAHHGAADAELLAEQRLGRQRRARCKAAGDDRLAEQVERMAVDVLDDRRHHRLALRPPSM
jgi:hypothetical protein